MCEYLGTFLNSFDFLTNFMNFLDGWESILVSPRWGWGNFSRGVYVT
jgi:hypothetical protein